MKLFELGVMWFVLTICPLMYSKKHREERKYILNEIREGRGILKEKRK